jgi:hypothetical protein
MADDHRYALTGAITAPVLNENGGVIGMATIDSDGLITAQIHDQTALDFIRKGLIWNIADGLTIGPRLDPAKKKEK